MIKKILLTLTVIAIAYLLIRWKQRKTAEIARNQASNTVPAPKTGIYYLAGSLVTLMVISVAAWIYYTLN
jgi:hypothetical protein